jgi:DNA-binding MurR/RpiR family transcriptional regulator
MREKYAAARQAQRELAAFIKEHPELTWQDIATERSVAICTVTKTAKMFGLQRGSCGRKTKNNQGGGK